MRERGPSRRALLGAGVTLLGSVAGCIRLEEATGEDDQGTETETDDQGTETSDPEPESEPTSGDTDVDTDVDDETDVPDEFWRHIDESDRHLDRSGELLEIAMGHAEEEAWDDCHERGESAMDHLTESRMSAENAMEIAEDSGSEPHEAAMDAWFDFIIVIRSLVDAVDELCTAGEDGESLADHWARIDDIGQELDAVEAEVEEAFDRLDD